MSEEVEAIGREIRRRRQALGMTLDVLARAAGLGANYIGGIELGHRDPSISTVLRIARGLRVEPGELLGRPALPADTIEAARLLPHSTKWAMISARFSALVTLMGALAFLPARAHAPRC